jgi:hypothetical protein
MRFNAGTVADPATRRIRFTQPLSLTSLTAVLVNRATGGTTENVTDRDANLLRTTGGRVTDYQMRLESFGGVVTTPEWASSNTDIATVDSDGYVSHVSNGDVTITASAAGQSVSASLTLSSTTGATTDDLISYVSGSMAFSVSDAVDSRIAGRSPSNALRIFTTQDHVGGVYVRNTSCWAADLDLTPISPWNSVGANTRAGTLISPRHVIFAAHYPAVAGMTIRFVQADNTVVTRTVTAVRTHPDYVPYFPDIQVGVLNSDVPAGITFAKVLPVSWEDKIAALGFSRSLPALCLDQEEKALISDWGYGVSLANFTSRGSLNTAQRALFYESKIGGDSGNPAFLIVNDQLVLLTVWTYGGAGSGTFTTPQIAAINAMMTTLGGGYQLTEIDLSGFPTYT